MKLCREQYNIYTDAGKQKNLCVDNNTIFTQMLENKRTFVSRTIQYLHRCLKIKDPLFGCQNWRGVGDFLLLTSPSKTISCMNLIYCLFKTSHLFFENIVSCSFMNMSIELNKVKNQSIMPTFK